MTSGTPGLHLPASLEDHQGTEGQAGEERPVGLLTDASKAALIRI